MATNRAVVRLIAHSSQQARDGVDYSPRSGARCPHCGARAKIYKTTPWEGALRVRYHRCHSRGCALAVLGVTIKSVEVDTAPAENASN